MNSEDFSESHTNVNFYSSTLEFAAFKRSLQLCSVTLHPVLRFISLFLIFWPVLKRFSHLSISTLKVCEDGVSEKKKENPGEMKKREATTANQ